MINEKLIISFITLNEHVGKRGMYFIYRLYRLVEQMEDECSTCVVLLHNVSEYIDITINVSNGISSKNKM